jgi:GT2 family glycosyltransferase
MNTQAGLPSLAVVVPAYNAEATLAQVLDALRSEPGIAELLVVDPASTDGTAGLARKTGVRVLALPARTGPAGARNAGVEATTAEIVLFVDSDCVIAPGVAARVREAFARDPGLVGLSGSYDANPPHRGAASLYMNLRHHHTHQHARRETTTFWGGLGAVRRAAFQRAGGFDSARFPWPMIEDIELGGRLAREGRLRLDPDLQCTHLKRWTLRSVIHTDVVRRAIPWSRLILETGAMPDDLNLKWTQRLAAALAPLALLSVPALPLLLIQRPPLAILPLMVIALSILLSAPLLDCFRRAAGLRFALAGWALHQLHLSYSAATFALCALRHRWRRPAGKDTS